LFTVIAQKRTGLNDNGITSKIYFDSTKLHRIDSIIEKGREQNKLPGVSTAIMQSGRIILAKDMALQMAKTKHLLQNLRYIRLVHFQNNLPLLQL
jgi:hypothetical protein